MRREGTQGGRESARAADRRDLVLYVAAGLLYVAVGAAFPEVLFSWLVGAGYLLLCVVALPALGRRLRS